MDSHLSGYNRGDLYAGGQFELNWFWLEIMVYGLFISAGPRPPFKLNGEEHQMVKVLCPYSSGSQTPRCV